MATPEPPPQPVFKEPRPVNPNSLPFFSRIVEDIIVNIFGRLEDDPRDLARLVCVCRRFPSVIKTSCYKRQCMRVIPCIVSELMQPNSWQDVLVEPPGGWEALQKVLVCCPGLSHAGILLNSWDYGLERAIGRSDDFEIGRREDLPKLGIKAEDVQDTGVVNTLDVEVKLEKSDDHLETQSENPQENVTKHEVYSRTYSQQENKPNEQYQCGTSERRGSDSASASTSFDVADTDSENSSSKELMGGDGPIKHIKKGDLHYHCKVMKEPRFHGSYRRFEREEEQGGSRSPRIRERRGSSRERSGNSGGGRRSIQTERRINHAEEPHLAEGVWTLTRDQGNKLLASRSLIRTGP